MKIIDLSAEVAHNMVRYPSAYLPEVGVVSVAKHETHVVLQTRKYSPRH